MEDAYQNLVIENNEKVDGLLVVEVIQADKDSSKIEIPEMVRVRVVGPRVTDEGGRL